MNARSPIFVLVSATKVRGHHRERRAVAFSNEVDAHGALTKNRGELALSLSTATTADRHDAIPHDATIPVARGASNVNTGFA